MPFFLSPFGNSQFVDTNGNPLSGGKINTYLAGTSTPATTYTTNLGTVAQANPVVLNARGLPANPIWLGNDVAYKFVLTDSADTVLMTVDNLVGINDTSESFTEWIVSGMVPTYLSATTFSVTGDQRSTLQNNRRLKYVLNSGTYYGYIVSTSFGSGVTTVTVAPDATNLDATLSSFSYGFVSATNTSIPQQFVIAGADKVPSRNAGTANALLTNNGTSSNWATVAQVQRVITATGTYTPTTGMVYCIVEMVGGGAGGVENSAGSFGGGGGGAGEYARGTFSAADIGASKAATIGAGGAANSAGGTTSLGTLLTAAGAGSTSGLSYVGGPGGTGGTGTGLHIAGGQGSTGSGVYSGPVLMGGSGGASFFGGGGRGGVGNLDHGSAGSAYGSGGGGNGNTSTTWSNGGAGKAGVIVITEFVLTAV